MRLFAGIQLSQVEHAFVLAGLRALQQRVNQNGGVIPTDFAPYLEDVGAQLDDTDVDSAIDALVLKING